MDNTQLFQFALSQITSNAVVILVIDYLKKSKYFPSVQADNKKLMHVLAVIGSGLAAIGVHSTFDHVTGTLVITGLTLSGVGHGLWSWAQTYATQELIYRGVFTKAGTPVTVVPTGDAPVIVTPSPVAPKT